MYFYEKRENQQKLLTTKQINELSSSSSFIYLFLIANKIRISYDLVVKETTYYFFLMF